MDRSQRKERPNLPDPKIERKRQSTKTEAAKFPNEWPTIVELPAYKCEKSKNLDEFKQTLDEYLSKVPDEPKCDGLSPGATNVHGRPTNTIIYQVVRRKEAWSDTVQELDPTTILTSHIVTISVHVCPS